MTPNLLQALHAISRALAGDPVLPEEPWIWIDALCINQDDKEEKAIQVPLMGEIFSKAQSVFVWLGPDHDKLTLDILSWVDSKLTWSVIWN